jgi:methionyl aminopeptidase
MHADLNETYLVGNVDAEGRALVKNTYECLMHAIAECEPRCVCELFIVCWTPPPPPTHTHTHTRAYGLSRVEGKPGVRYRDIGAIISKHAATANFSVVRTYCGHGINDLFHSAPNIPHYSSACVLVCVCVFRESLPL